MAKRAVTRGKQHPSKPCAALDRGAAQHRAPRHHPGSQRQLREMRGIDSTLDQPVGQYIQRANGGTG